jgi:multiphosphoryl transfer protein
MPTLEIQAPFDGWCTSLADVPDQVFAQRLLGDGLAVDPTSGIVLAPCAGEIIAVAAARHAISLRATGGAEVLIHVGIDTVQLEGRGFVACVGVGARVAAGDELLRVDLDSVARGAKSLLTPVIVTPLDGLQLLHCHAPGAVRAGELLFEVSHGAAHAVVGHADEAAVQAGAFITETLLVTLPNGLHMRPAARIAQSLKGIEANVLLRLRDKMANARSPVEIMALEVRAGDELLMTASGAGARDALDSLCAAYQEAVRAELSAGPAGRLADAPARPAPDKGGPVPGDGLVHGTVAVRGLGVGRVVLLAQQEMNVAEFGLGETDEGERLERARATVRARLQERQRVAGSTGGQIIAAHLAFLEDARLNQLARSLIEAGKSAGFAWRAAIQHLVDALQALDLARLRERAEDLRDIEFQVLRALEGVVRPPIPALPDQAVLVADALLPSDMTALDPARVKAICLGHGGASSHVAILAAAMEVPMLVGLGSGLSQLTEGTLVIVDGDRGTVNTSPTAAALAHAQAELGARRVQRELQKASAQGECRTKDGIRIHVAANLGSVVDANAAIAHGAEGCGLLRTEFLFASRESAPGEQEQRGVYQELAGALRGQPMVLRLLDAGGDKPLPFLLQPPEENPALGLRGIRATLLQPDLLRTQLRAALQVTPTGVVRILVPMVTDLEEIRAVRAHLAELAGELGIATPVAMGAMVETPAAALIANLLVREADFLSIGSNDLIQYALAMDRGHPVLGAHADVLHPAVLRLIAMTAHAGADAGKEVAVCGAAAADELAIPILLGLGVRALSVVPTLVPAVKRQIRNLTLTQCQALAGKCLALGSAAQVRALAVETLSQWEET